MSPPVKGFYEIISCLPGLLDGVLVLDTRVLLLKQQLAGHMNCYTENRSILECLTLQFDCAYCSTEQEKRLKKHPALPSTTRKHGLPAA